MKILKTLVPAEDGLFLYDTIEYEGKLWLVPEWIDGTPTKGYSRPARIICLTFLPHFHRSAGTDYVLDNPIPKSVWQGHVPPELKNMYIVVENPDIVVETPPTFH